MPVVAVVGSRGFTNLDLVTHTVRVLGDRWSVVSGKATGVDLAAAAAARANGINVEEIPPDWKRYPSGEYGKDFAPKQRNKEIVDRADIVWAFWDGRSTGTAHAVCYAVSKGKPVIVRLDEASATEERPR